MATNASIATMFMGGFGPGILCGVLLIGIVTQLMLDPEADMAQAEELVDFMVRLGLPVTMEDIRLDQVPEEELMAWCRKQCVPGNRLDAIAQGITAEELMRAMHAASAFGATRKQRAKSQS
ncbi:MULTISPECIES: hypothetical protein [unclassified Oscillibacter]|uniref:hypothetical protein n=1 Tax=unclassified Oscillibacter TaxID=2629304 RepID=UPI0025E042D6|nr:MULTISPECIES: hypothetical protein [unclassified Oscillibacter]